MGDIFEGVDLEELANSETPIVDSGETSENTTGTETETNDGTVPEITTDTKGGDEGIDLDALANAETILDTTSTEEDSEGKDGSETTSQTPATKPDRSSPSSQDEIFTSFASALTEAGVFSSLDEEELNGIKTTEDLMSAIAKQIKTNEYATLNENQKEYLEALKAGIPQPEFAERKHNADLYKNLNEEEIKVNQNLQYELMKRSFIAQGFDAGKAEKYAVLSVKSDTGVEDALQAREDLVAHEEKQIQAKIAADKEAATQRQESSQKAIAALKSKLEETSEILPGIKITTPTKDKIFSSMTTPVKMKEDSPLNEVMDKYENDEDYKFKLHALHVLTKGFTNFDKLIKVGTTKATQSFTDALSTSSFGKPGRAGSGVADHVQTGSTAAEIGESLKTITFK
jgi:hypothetical protein